MDDNAINQLVRDETRAATNPLWEANKEIRVELREVRDGIGSLEKSFARVEGSNTEMICAMKKNGNGKNALDFLKWVKLLGLFAIFLGTLIGTALAAFQGVKLF